ncbi:MAG: hypothetical protein KA138_06870 [Saprospiraceae bacterium]|nr:hypothetical protein [Saprospiraceae bacterium]
MVKYESCPAFKIADLWKEGLNREIKAEVVFGTPSKHCAGAGICMVSISSAKTRVITCPSAPVWISSSNPTSLKFRFEKSCLQSNISNRHFSQREFMVEEAFHLPLRLVRQLGLASHWGQPGIYPIIEQESDWLLCFQLI